MPGELLLNGRQPLLERPVAVEQHPIGAPYALDVVARKAAALHTDDVDATQCRPEANRHSKRDDICGNAAHTADHRTFTNPHELVNRNQTTEERVVAHRDMAAEHHIVREGYVVTNAAIMRNVA